MKVKVTELKRNLTYCEFLNIFAIEDGNSVFLLKAYACNTYANFFLHINHDEQKTISSDLFSEMKKQFTFERIEVVLKNTKDGEIAYTGMLHGFDIDEEGIAFMAKMLQPYTEGTFADREYPVFAKIQPVLERAKKPKRAFSYMLVDDVFGKL